MDDTAPNESAPFTLGISTKSHWLNVREITRFGRDQTQESLQFRPGVNVIVGPPNTGKSHWLKMLDYALGDDSPAEAALGAKLAKKYDGVRVALTINDKALTVERYWGKAARRSKVIVDGEAYDTDDFSDELMGRLGLPLLHVPSGNPFSGRTWPRLGWRTLYRHIYRHEFSWDDIASDQPVAEQFACIMMFLDSADRLFPEEFSEMVRKRHEVDNLRSRKEQFVVTLEEITRELIAIQETSVALTGDSLDAAAARIKEELNARTEKRQALLVRLQRQVAAETSQSEQSPQTELAEIGNELASKRKSRESAAEHITAIRERRAGVSVDQRYVTEELQKIERARAVHEELADLRVTHCPSCDQRVTRTPPANSCKLCLQPYSTVEGDFLAADQRLAFETRQLESEAKELGELIQALDNEYAEAQLALRNLDDEIRSLEEKLRPARAAATWILPPELSIIDEERGKLLEQLRQVERVRAALGRREDLSSRIDELTTDIERLSAEVALQKSSVKFDRANELLAAGMNTYLNALNAGAGPHRWHGGAVNVRIKDKAVEFKLGKQKWYEALGATNMCYFLAAYQFALLQLSSSAVARYPGIAVIDLPANLSDNRIQTDDENYLVEPFISLLSREGLSNAQLIITGHGYKGLDGAHRLELTEIYEQSDNAGED